MMPMRGLRISTQPIARSSGGVTIGIRIAAANRLRPGRSVRSISRLSASAMAIATAVLPTAKTTVLRTSM